MLLHEGMTGLDTIYDGAAESKSTACLFGPRGGKWSSAQCYGAAFRSVTPRPWQRPPSRHDRAVGPADYEPFRDTHLLSSASVSWQSRGRTGPVGFPFEAGRRSPPFRSSTARFHSTNSQRNKRGAITKEDCFVLASDARREALMRADFVDQLQRRVSMPMAQAMPWCPRPATFGA